MVGDAGGTSLQEGWAVVAGQRGAQQWDADEDSQVEDWRASLRWPIESIECYEYRSEVLTYD